MSGFNNPVVGALNLIRKAIRSPNYVAGSAGWSVDQDGTAEFNDIAARGTIIVGPDGMPQVIISQNPGQGFVEFPTGDASEASAGAIFSVINAFGLGLLGLFLNGPTQTDNADFITAGIVSGAAGVPPQLIIADNNDGTVVQVDTNGLQVAGDVVVTGTLTGQSIAGSVSVSFVTQTSFTVAVVFPTAFGTVPAVMTNIASGSGTAGHWSSRAISVTTAGFTLFVFADTGAAAQTWSNIPVQWIAIGT